MLVAEIYAYCLTLLIGSGRIDFADHMRPQIRTATGRACHFARFPVRLDNAG
jgi:hypothetical protein